MKNKLIYAALAVTVAFTISFQVFYNSVSAQKKTNWEYKKLRIHANYNSFEPELNKLGDEGWELTTYQTPDESGGTGHYIFKRLK